jgi:type I restriction enzyme, S subunit
VTELPSGWGEARLSEVADHVLGKMLDKRKNKGKPRPYIRNLNVQWGSFDLDDLKEMRITDEERERYSVRRGDVLVCEGGEPGRCAVWDSDDEMYFQKALHRVRPSEKLNPRFLAHFLRYAATNQLLDPLFTGSTIKHLPGEKLAQIPVPLPPRAEQDRIVQRLEILDRRVGEGERSFHEAMRLMEQFYLTILHAGFSGQLTGHEDDWKRVRMGDAVDQCLGKMLDRAKNRGKPRPYLRNVNVQWGRFELGDVKQMRIEDSERTRYSVLPGDLLVCEGGEPGRCAVWTSEEEMYFQKALHRVRPGPKLDVDFLQRYLAYAARLRLLDTYFTGTTIKHLPGEKLRDVPVPMPSRAIQREIVDAIDTWLSVADRLQGELDQHLTQLRAFRSGLLHAAVSGRLVAQDPTDEPASELLARCRDGRAETERETEGATA